MTFLRVMACLFGAVFIATATPVSAQDYGAIAEPGQSESASENTAERTGERTGESPSIGAGPDFEAYGQVAQTYEPETALEFTQQRVNIFRQKAQRIFGSATSYLDDVKAALDASSPTGSAFHFLGVFLFTAVLLVIGRAGAHLFALSISLPIMRRVQRGHPENIVDKLPVLAVRVGLQVVGIIITLLIAAAIGSGFYVEDQATLKTVLVIASTFALVQLIDVLWRMVVSPYLPEYRIPTFSDRDARRLYHWLAAGAALGVSSNFAVLWMHEMNVPEEALALTLMTVSLIAVVVIFLTIRSCGGAISRALLGGYARSEATLPAAIASMLWRPLVILYMIGAWLEMSYRLIMGLEMRVPLLAGAFLVLLAGLVVYALTVYIIERIFQRARAIRLANAAAEKAEQDEIAAADRALIRDALSDVDDDIDGDGDEEGGAGPALMHDKRPPPRHKGMRTFEDLAHRVASLFALGAGFRALFYVWIGPGAFDEGTYLDVAQDLIDVIFIGYIAYIGARIWMDRKIAEEGGDMADQAEPGDEGGAAGAASRVATILPLFRSFVLFTIATASLFLVLMELGVNVAPLFAGAGVVGLAIGFGAQSLVRDILSGVFFLSDDAFRKGEYIDVGDVKGTVEKISLRSFQLRHHLGALNTIPFGEIKHLTNYSRDWVMMKLPLRLTYDTDVDKVRKLIKKLGQELLGHPTEGHKFVQPLKSQGVYMMEDSAMIIRVKFMTRPGDQWTTRKLVYQEIRSLFEREGIHFAHKEVTVRIPGLKEGAGDEPLSGEDQRAIGAAARRAVEEEGMVPAGGGDTR